MDFSRKDLSFKKEYQWKTSNNYLFNRKEGYEPFNDFLPKETFKKLDYIAKIREMTRIEIITDFIEIEYDNMIDG